MTGARGKTGTGREREARDRGGERKEAFFSLSSTLPRFARALNSSLPCPFLTRAAREGSSKSVLAARVLAACARVTHPRHSLGPRVS